MKYRLKKSYPGSPKLGTEVVFSETHQVYNYNGGDFFSELPKNQVENLPEFWEKVEEPTYEILSFKSKSVKDYILYLKGKGFISVHGFEHVPSQSMLSNPNFDIHSVKRLSDGEVFTVGDNIKSGSTQYEILGFEKKDTTTQHGWLTIGVIYNSGGTDLSIIEKVKKPLFTTEDGVEKFEGDLFVPVNVSVDDADNYTIRGLNSEAKPYNTKIQEEARKNGVLWFSTKEAAEEYILMNKPCLSVKEVVDILANYALTIQSRGKIYHTLVEKATQRNDSK